MLCPGVRNPTASISRQSRCSGSGPPWISCVVLSLLMNVTRPPAAIVTSGGVMPVAVIATELISGGSAGVGAGDGVGAGAGTDEGDGPP